MTEPTMKDATDIFSKIPDLNYYEEAVELNHVEFEKLIENRRSVRVFTQEPIPEQIVQRCLDIALLAPNSSNLQCWEFYWVRENSAKLKLVEACMSQPAARTAGELIVAVARTKSWKKNRLHLLELFKTSPIPVPKSAVAYYAKLVPFVYSQGVCGTWGLIKRMIYNLLGLFKPMPREPVSNADMRVWANKTVALACQNFMLAMRAYGYDSCPMEGMDSRRISSLLKLPPDAEVTMVLACGKRAKQGIYGPRARLPRDLFIKII